MDDEQGPRLKGRVIWYNASPTHGYGFIAIAGRSEDLFVHASELARSEIEALEKGDWVYCSVGVAPDSNRECAKDIELIA